MKPPRDILLIILDDVPRNSLSAYGASHGLAPNLASLSTDGVTFDAARTTSPLCTPARWSILTGRYAANASSIVSNRPWRNVGFNTFLNGNEPTIAHALRAVDDSFTTCLIGKYHLGFPLSPSLRTGRSAFSGGARGHTYGSLTAAIRKFGGFDSVSAFGGNKQLASLPHHPEWMAAEAERCLTSAHLARQRAFVVFAPTLPHAPFSLPGSLQADPSLTPAGPVAPVPPEWRSARASLLQKLDRLGYVCLANATRCTEASSAPRPCGASSPAGRSRSHSPSHILSRSRSGAEDDAFGPSDAVALDMPHSPWLHRSWLRGAEHCEQSRLSHLFAAGLGWIDQSIGRVLSSLHRSSLVVLTADHGASFLGKGAPYEAGITVPLVMRWSGVITPGLRMALSVSHLDIFPTILEAAQGSTSGAAAKRPRLASSLHGESMLPKLVAASSASSGDGGQAVGDRSAYDVESRPHFVEIGYARAIRHEGFKLILVNDPTTRCGSRSDPAAEEIDELASAKGRVCRNFHGLIVATVPPSTPPAVSDAVGAPGTGHRPSIGAGFSSLSGLRFGLGNMTFDAAARHPASFCDRRQLYNLRDDPLEQKNLATSQPDVYDRLLSKLLDHVRSVEAANPAIVRAQGGLMGCGRGGVGTRKRNTDAA